MPVTEPLQSRPVQRVCLLRIEGPTVDGAEFDDGFGELHYLTRRVVKINSHFVALQSIGGPAKATQDARALAAGVSRACAALVLHHRQGIIQMRKRLFVRGA